MNMLEIGHCEQLNRNISHSCTPVKNYQENINIAHIPVQNDTQHCKILTSHLPVSLLPNDPIVMNGQHFDILSILASVLHATLD
jgi:hypothetical protein